MDSLTQIALGAAVGEAAGGRQFGRRAASWGAVCGTLPDLDVLVPLGDAVRDFTYHRSASHSLLVMALVTPLVVWLVLKCHPGTREHRWRWAALVYGAFATHALLDACTVYGTQLLWPLPVAPVGWSFVFIIDPLYTLPLLVGVITALAASRARPLGHRANTIGLVLSTGYLAWALGAKLVVEDAAARALAAQGIAADAVLTTPAPFTTLLWRVLAVDGEHYHEGFRSLLDGDAPLRFERHPRHPELVEPIADTWAVQRLAWFTRGFNAASLQGDDVVVTDLRMGLEPGYVFNFRVGRVGNPHVREAPVERRPTVRDWSRLPWVWQRIVDPAATWVPAPG